MRSGNNIHRSMVGGDEGSGRTERTGKPDRDFRNTDGMEPGGKTPMDEIENWVSRRRRRWESSNNMIWGIWSKQKRGTIPLEK